MSTDITKEKLIKKLDNRLLGWAYRDIYNASVEGNAKLAGFILGACFIDAMSGFYFGIDKKSSKANSGYRFKEFVKKYLPQYNSDKLYFDLRCGLVHSYAEGGTYVFTDDSKVGLHFSRTKKNKILLNLEDFVLELKEAYGELKHDILIDNKIFNKAKKRYLSMGLMDLIDFKDS